MSIRLRHVNGLTIAVCAARSVSKAGDVYLNDEQHAALYEKFADDFRSEGFDSPPTTPSYAQRMETEESNNEARVWWDKTFGDCKAGDI